MRISSWIWIHRYEFGREEVNYRVIIDAEHKYSNVWIHIRPVVDLNGLNFTCVNISTHFYIWNQFNNSVLALAYN